MANCGSLRFDLGLFLFWDMLMSDFLKNTFLYDHNKSYVKGRIDKPVPFDEINQNLRNFSSSQEPTDEDKRGCLISIMLCLITILGAIPILYISSNISERLNINSLFITYLGLIVLIIIAVPIANALVPSSNRLRQMLKVDGENQHKGSLEKLVKHGNLYTGQVVSIRREQGLRVIQFYYKNEYDIQTNIVREYTTNSDTSLVVGDFITVLVSKSYLIIL